MILLSGTARHYYNVFDAQYAAKFEKRTDADYFLGNISDFSNREYFVHLLNYLKNKSRGGTDYSEVIKAVEEKI